MPTPTGILWLQTAIPVPSDVKASVSRKVAFSVGFSAHVVWA